MASSESVPWLIVLVGLTGMSYFLWMHYSCHSGSQLGLLWLPAELRGAELVYAEKTFRVDGDMPIVARLDRAYRNRKGLVILIDLKTRRINRPYLSDVIELSAQRLAMRAQTGETVAQYGFVLIKRTGSMFTAAHRVDLMSDEEIKELARRREHLLRGNLVPNYACSRVLCARCVYARACEAPSRWDEAP